MFMTGLLLFVHYILHFLLLLKKEMEIEKVKLELEKAKVTKTA